MVNYIFYAVLFVSVIGFIYYLSKFKNFPDETNANVRYNATADLCKEIEEKKKLIDNSGTKKNIVRIIYKF